MNDNYINYAIYETSLTTMCQTVVYNISRKVLTHCYISKANCRSNRRIIIEPLLIETQIVSLCRPSRYFMTEPLVVHIWFRILLTNLKFVRAPSSVPVRCFVLEIFSFFHVQSTIQAKQRQIFVYDLNVSVFMSDDLYEVVSHVFTIRLRLLSFYYCFCMLFRPVFSYFFSITRVITTSITITLRLSWLCSSVKT